MDVIAFILLLHHSIPYNKKHDNTHSDPRYKSGSGVWGMSGAFVPDSCYIDGGAPVGTIAAVRGPHHCFAMGPCVCDSSASDTHGT